MGEGIPGLSCCVGVSKAFRDFLWLLVHAYMKYGNSSPSYSAVFLAALVVVRCAPVFCCFLSGQGQVWCFAVIK